ncbi:MAG TPA: response regulator [Flavobacterium sp.]|nr:response regulator [Flavobacterium sp.]
MRNEKITVILTDDDREEHLLFKEVVAEFEAIGSLISFEQGDALLDYLKKEHLKETHLLFLDLNMPSLSGFDCLSQIRANHSLGRLKILIYSTSSAEKDIEETFLHGADFYITKPCDFRKMKDMFEQVLKIDWNAHSKAHSIQGFKFKS